MTVGDNIKPLKHSVQHPLPLYRKPWLRFFGLASKGKTNCSLKKGLNLIEYIFMDKEPRQETNTENWGLGVLRGNGGEYVGHAE